MANAPEQTLEWVGDSKGHLSLIDQTLLPTQLQPADCHTVEAVWGAIKVLRVRGAPAIGIAAHAAYASATNLDFCTASHAQLRQHIDEVTSYLATSRPTAVNLFWALERMSGKAQSLWEAEFSVKQIADERTGSKEYS